MFKNSRLLYSVIWILWALCYGLSFPTYNLSFLSWFCFVPVIIFSYLESNKKVAIYSFFSSFIFLILTLYWIYGFWLPAPFLMFMIYAFYYAFAFVSASIIAKKFPALRTFAFPLSFLSMEILRSVGFHGFQWNILAHSQWNNLLAIQMADIFGVHGVSFVILLVNSLISEIVINYFKKRKFFIDNKSYIISLFLIRLFTFGYGYFSLNKYQRIIKNSPGERVALLQPHTPSRAEWWSKRWQYYGIFWRLHAEAMLKEPEFIIWCETMVKNYVWYYLSRYPLDEEVNRFNIRFIKMPEEFDVPILMTSPDTYDGKKNYNTADYLEPGRKGVQRNEKIHLVPFGEWMPGYDSIPIVKKVMEIEGAGSFVPSTNFNVIQGRKSRFRVLVCYEDMFPSLARIFIKKRVNYFINGTNDGWAYKLGFKHPMYQHLAGAILTSVSVRRPIARAANTGITCIIKPDGRIEGNIGTYNTGFYVGNVPLIDDKIETFYVKIGYIFPYIIFSIYVIIFLVAIFKRGE
ncbi:MAG: apolipoprotein N-acyltransferase [Brevinematales bacterium]|nr:apolipoprotein N-acyltransferase [Brevinematales bacterium]